MPFAGSQVFKLFANDSVVIARDNNVSRKSPNVPRKPVERNKKTSAQKSPPEKEIIQSSQYQGPKNPLHFYIVFNDKLR
jgi:hypothetical protein